MYLVTLPMGASYSRYGIILTFLVRPYIAVVLSYHICLSICMLLNDKSLIHLREDNTATQPNNKLLTSALSHLIHLLFPYQFNIPVPPNPVKAKKAAAMRAAKEAKMKNPNPPPPPADEEELKKRKERAKKTGRSRANIGGQEDEEDQSVHKPTRWYMGQYGVNDGNNI